MRLLDRYLLRELLVPLAYCLFGFVVLWLTSDLFANLGDLQRKKLTGGDIAEYYFVQIPEVMVLILPIALLLALLYTLSNHARHHEITAIRAAGISLWRLAAPYFFVGIVMGAALFVMNEYLVPDANDAEERIKARHDPDAVVGAETRRVRNFGFENEREGRKWFMSVYSPDRAEMIKPQVHLTDSEGQRLWIVAERAVHTNGSWLFLDVRKYREPEQTNTLLQPLMQTNAMVLPDLSETPDEIESQIRIGGAIGLQRARRADLAISEIRNFFRLHPNPKPSERAWLETKLQGRLAAPWTCLVVVLIALPFGAASGRRNVFVGVASSIVLCFAFFVLQQVGLALGAGGYVPPWLGAWAPNIAFGLGGMLMSARVR